MSFDVHMSFVANMLMTSLNLSNVSQPTTAGVLLHSLSQSFNSTSLERACVRNTRASSALWVYDNALYKLTFLLSNELVCAVISCCERCDCVE